MAPKKGALGGQRGEISDILANFDLVVQIQLHAYFVLPDYDALHVLLSLALTA